MKTLILQHISKTYNQGNLPAVKDISLELDKGEILTLVGPSGCGKTTILRLIAGLEYPDSGLIQLNGREIASGSSFTPPEKRGVGMVFQDHALFPHMNVYDNVSFGLRGKNRDHIKERVEDMLGLVNLIELARRFPHALSGGERQRVALARALAPQPDLVLMDEPFSSLDKDLRCEMREQVRHLLKSINATVLFVTHDQEEALFLGDRIAVIRAGRLEQAGTPEGIFQNSATHFVAEFMGNSCFLPGMITSEGIQTNIGLLSQQTNLPTGTGVEVALRADDVNFHPDQAGNGSISDRIYLGMMNLYRLKLDTGEVIEAYKEHTEILPEDLRVNIFMNPGHPLSIFPRVDQ